MKNQIIKGAFILSLAGIITRIIGFYYRIFLSKTIGATGMGLYQMIFPIFGLCYSFAVFGIQTAISRFTAIKAGLHDRSGMYTVLKAGLSLSAAMSAAAAILIFRFSDDIALHILDEPRCGELIRIMALSLPIGAVHSCISGYYLGKKSAHVAAISQLLEQIVRVSGVYITAEVMVHSSSYAPPAIAVWGMVFGEIASALLCICFISGEKSFFSEKLSNLHGTVKEIFGMAYPISMSKIIVSLFMTLEAILIPITLKQSGIKADNAIAIYGILTGMAMPFIMFPSTITNSIAAMILPSVAEHQAAGNYAGIGRTASTVIKYCLSIGIFCTGYFYIYGERLGEIFFDSSDAGLYISVLSWLCPFLYMSATLGGILNGMGRTRTTFIHSTAAALIRLLSIIFLVPPYGIKGCLFGILASHIICTLLHTYVLYRCVHFRYDTYSYIIKPLFMTVLSLGISLFILYLMEASAFCGIPAVIISICSGGIIFMIYLVYCAKKEAIG